MQSNVVTFTIFKHTRVYGVSVCNYTRYTKKTHLHLE